MYAHGVGGLRGLLVKVMPFALQNFTKQIIVSFVAVSHKKKIKKRGVVTP
jgi:hypothetical protein